MPIYAYRCESCGFAQDMLRKLSDPPLSVCPECGKDTFRKQVTAAGFQLKGSGWYVTDFRNNGSAPAKGGKKDGESSTGTAAAEGGSAASGGAGATGDKAASSGSDAGSSTTPAASSSGSGTSGPSAASTGSAPSSGGTTSS